MIHEKSEKFGKKKPYLGYYEADDNGDELAVCQIHTFAVMVFDKKAMANLCPYCLWELQPPSEAPPSSSDAERRIKAIDEQIVKEEARHRKKMEELDYFKVLNYEEAVRSGGR